MPADEKPATDRSMTKAREDIILPSFAFRIAREEGRLILKGGRDRLRVDFIVNLEIERGGLYPYP